MQTYLDPKIASQHWQLKPNVSLGPIADDYLVVLWLGQRILIKTSLAKDLPDILTYLQESRSFDQLLEHVGPKWNQKNLSSLLMRLAEHRLLTLSSDASATTAPSSSSPVERLWRPYLQLFSSSKEAEASAIAFLEKTQLHVVSRDAIPNGFLADWSLSSGTPEQFALTNEKTPNIVVVLTSSTDFRLMERLAPQTLSSRFLTLPILLDPFGAIVGPFLGGPGRPCFACLTHRLKGNLKAHVDVTAETPKFWPATYWQKLNAVVSEELFKQQSQLAYTPLNRGAFIFDFLNHRSEYEEVFPVPACHSCDSLSKDGFGG